jgi:hypothetical protein
MDSSSDSFSVDLPEDLMQRMERIAVQRGQMLEELLGYILSVAVGLKEPDPGDPGGEALFQLAQIYKSRRLGHG